MAPRGSYTPMTNIESRMWVQRQRHTLWRLWALARILDGRRNLARGHGVGCEADWADARYDTVCSIPRTSAGDRKPRAMAFEYTESKIAEKDALDVRKAVVELLCDDFTYSSGMMNAASSFAISRLQDDLEEKHQV